jgi:hypothetical protein
MATARAPLLFCDTRNANLIPALPVCVSACYSRGIIGPRIGVISPVYHAVESSNSAQSAGSVWLVPATREREESLVSCGQSNIRTASMPRSLAIASNCLVVASVLLIMDVGRGKPPKSQASWRTERRVATFQNPVRLQNGEALTKGRRW